MNTRDSKRIDTVTIKRIQDDDGDLSWLGEFADTADTDYSIVAFGQHEGEFVKDLPCECGHLESRHNDDGCTECLTPSGETCDYFDRVDVPRGRDYRYFNPEVDSSVTDDSEQRTYALQDYKRARDYGQTWAFEGVRADARVIINGTVQVVTSGGLYGIESDSEANYFDEVGKEQLAELKGQLHALGFSKRAISAAFRDVVNEQD